MLANCGANTHRLVRSLTCCVKQRLPKYALHTQKYKCSSTLGHPLCQDLWFLAEKQFVSIFYTMRSSSNFFIRSLQIISCTFYKSLFFLNYSKLLCDGDQMQQLLMHCFGVRVSSVSCVIKRKKLCAMYTNQADKRSAGVLLLTTLGVTRLDGTRGKKQVWRPHVRTWTLLEANSLYWRKYLWHFGTFRRPQQWFGAPYWLGARGITPPFVTPLKVGHVQTPIL